MDTQGSNDDFELLLFNVIDQVASEADFAALVTMLRESEEKRKRASQFLFDEALLGGEIGAAVLASRLKELAVVDSDKESRNVVPMRTTLPASRSWPVLSYVNQHGLAVAAAAVLVIGGLVAQNWLMMEKFSRLHELAVQGESKGEVEVLVAEDGAVRENSLGKNSSGRGIGEIVGRVIGLSDVQWQADADEFTYGDSLGEGQNIQLASGNIEILLTNGAKLTATGPVDFELSSLLEMDLDKGRIVAAVPRTARGYTIMTPTSELVDVGTQFGVSVAESGDTELHVFDGEVVARARSENVLSESVHAKENEALRFGAKGAMAERFSAQEKSFVRRLGQQPSAEELPQLPHVRNLCLWYAADMIRDVQVGGPVSVWRDILAGDNIYANDARQFDPQRFPTLMVDDSGRKSLRFDGRLSSLQIDAMENTGSYTIFVACAPGPVSFANEHQGSIFFKYGQSPSLEMSILSDFSARSWVWPGPGQDNMATVKSEPIADSQVSLIACRYDSLASRSQLWLNGESQQVASAPIELKHCDQSYLGSHSDPNDDAYFFGNIYEVVIYDGEVEAESIEELNSYFFNRYGINQ